jgi:hypothetical protein
MYVIKQVTAISHEAASVTIVEERAVEKTKVTSFLLNKSLIEQVCSGEWEAVQRRIRHCDTLTGSHNISESVYCIDRPINGSGVCQMLGFRPVDIFLP